ncbi:hypothetical protein ACFLZV_03160 [Candidatus Margulisiibacteriota bacterium]
MNNKLQILFMMIVFLAVSCIGLNASGGEALLLTELGTSARMIGLGNIEGFEDGAATIFENPAGLKRVKGLSIAAFGTKLMGEVDYRNIGVALETDFGAFGIGFMDASVGGIPHTMQVSGWYDIEYYYRYENMLGKLAYGLGINEWLQVGCAANYYKNSMDSYSSEGWNLDVGMIMELEPLEVSLVGKNVLRSLKLKYEDSSDSNYSGEESYPYMIVLGGKYNLGDFDILGQVKGREDRSRNLINLGLHYSPWFLKLLHMYGGYKEYFGTKNVLHIQTLGVGLNLFGLRVDYAYENCDHVDYSTNHYMSLSMAF